MERICIFDMFKVGIGPSSSHTLGPWRAAERFLGKLTTLGVLASVDEVAVHLYGSLAKTGRGHGTDRAVQWGLAGLDPETVPPGMLDTVLAGIAGEQSLHLAGKHFIGFDSAEHIEFHFDASLPMHPNGLRFVARAQGAAVADETYYSIGGGFVVQDGEVGTGASVTLPCPIDSAAELRSWCASHKKSVADIVRMNERAWRTDEEIDAGLLHLWQVMRDSIWRGCRAEGVLPGGLNLKRRAAGLVRALSPEGVPDDPDDWEVALRAGDHAFEHVIDALSCFALAVNEENAAFGRVVTAPTNGAAGVIPAVLMYERCFRGGTDADTVRFLLTAGEIGSIFKKCATISAAMGGCQAEIGVSSAMAAAGLTACRGGCPEQVLIAAEIAMEHHLGLTCDPVGGLVQIPCIERNAMGAVKAITASELALKRDPAEARVSLDDVIATMWKTAQDMSSKYKETSEGGLAVQLPVNLSEC